MRHSDIAEAAARGAVEAACLAADQANSTQVNPPPGLHDLYTYARDRGFPPPETLARKHMSLANDHFTWPSLDAAPEFERAFYTTFRAVAQALEPFHEEGSENDEKPQKDPDGAYPVDEAPGAGGQDADTASAAGAAADPDGAVAAGAADGAAADTAGDQGGAADGDLGGVADDAAGPDSDADAGGGDGAGNDAVSAAAEAAENKPAAAKKKSK